ncbi:MAG: hypothetical protein NBV65_05405 [Burkholderiaceae bacterium]|nr:hypothetical protein [Burkholderiaceae bacterium]
MRVYLIDPVARTVHAEDVADGEAGIGRLIGYDSLDFDEIDDNGDRLFFDESCFIRHGPDMPRFKVDSLAPVAGRGVITGGQPGGKPLSDAIIALDALRARVAFL